MSKYVVLAGMAFNLAAGILHFAAPPGFEAWILPTVSLGIVLTVGGTISLLLRADW